MDPALSIELAALSRQKAMNETLERGDSEVQHFYRGTTVFLTGGSGFLGKQLLEKMLRACDIDKVYILLRPKKGRSVLERLADMLQDPVYDLVRKKKPTFAEKIIPVEGDASEIKLGLSDQDWSSVVQNVNVVFHMAATTRFDEPLRVSTLINVRGTREALTLAKACHKLKSFVYVSTTYAIPMSGNNVEVKEDFHCSPMPPTVLLDMVENMDEKMLSSIENSIIKGYANTYTFAKSVAEEVVRSMADNVPVSIVRPAVVISSYREPSPGWADMSCAYGASGLVLGPATGLIHVSYVGDDTRYSLVPVDYVNNAILVAGWQTGIRTTKEIKIYAVSSARNLFHSRQVATALREIGDNLPTPLAVWYMFAINTSNKLLFLILTWILHYIPGYVLDTGCLLLRRPPMFTKLYKKVYKTSLALSYFTTNTWIFNDSNTDKLYQSLTADDKLIFNFDTTDIDIKEYLVLWCVGLRKYLLKDGIKNTEFAKKKQFWLHKLHCIVSVGYVLFLYKIVSFLFYCLSYVPILV